MEIEFVVWDAVGRSCLAQEGDLPRLPFSGGAAVEPPAVLVEAARRRWGMDVAFVRVAADTVAEVEYLGGALPAHFTWCPRAIKPKGSVRAPWHRPGWLGSVLDEVDAELSRVDLRRTGPPHQWRHTTISGILRIPTDRGPVWLKTVLPIFAHEPRVIRWVAGFADAAVPSVIAEGEGWWLSAPFPEEGWAPTNHFIMSMAEIQIESIAYVQDLRALGCPLRPLSGLPTSVARLAQRSDLATPEDGALLQVAWPRLAEVCAETDDLGFPDTLVHGDLNPENVLHTPAGWFLFDWTDACVGNPLVDLALAVDGDSEQVRHRIMADYGARWAALLPPQKVERALRAAPAIGAAHQAVSYQWILDKVDRSAADLSDGAQLLGLLNYWVRRLVDALQPTP